jgi:hypothetical protein
VAESWLAPRLVRRAVKVVGLLTLGLLLVDLNRDGERCEQECFGTYRTYEPGQPWTNYEDSWQWDAQNALAAIGFIAAVAAMLYLIPPRLNRALVLTGVSLLFSAAWIAWVALSPPIG